MVKLVSDASRNENDDELAAISKLLDSGQLRVALKRLSDWLTRRGDRASLRIRQWVTSVLSEEALNDTERKNGRLTPKDDGIARSIVLAKARKLHEAACALANGNSDSLNKILGEVARWRDENDVVEVARQARSPKTAADPVSSFDELAVLDAQGIGKRYGGSGFRLQPIDVNVRPGQVLGIVGTNGSGKSTLLDILRGAHAPDEGRIGYPVLARRWNDWQTIKSQIGYVPQRSWQWKGTVRETLEYAAAMHGIRGQDNLNRVAWLMARHGLVPYQHHQWSELSSGYRMRVDLVIARIHKPRLLILDEPLANLDLVSQQIFLDDIEQMAKGEAGLMPGIVLTSQHLYELEALISALPQPQPDLIVLSGGRRLDVPKDRQRSYFELSGSNLEFDALMTGLAPVRTSVDQTVATDAAADFSDIRVGATTALVPADPGTSLKDLTVIAEENGIALSSIRDVTHSARIELEAGEAPPPLTVFPEQPS